MGYNVVEEYIEFLKKKYLDFFKMIFRNKYQKNLCLPFLEKYISVRYFNETNYLTEKDFINRVNKELVDLAEKIANDDNVEDVKNIVALFGYIVYFDDVCVIEHDVELINTLVNDKVIKIDNKEGLKAYLKEWYVDLRKGKDNFDHALSTKDFTLLEERVYRKLYYLTLAHNVKISNLYSEYAIDRAYNTGTVGEDKLFIEYILASHRVLESAIRLDFSRYYLVDFVSSLYPKEKKSSRLLEVINNPLTKKFIVIRITYSDYKDNKQRINDLINDGYTYALELDSKYTGNADELVLFPYILVNEDSPEYELFARVKDKIKSKVVKL